MRNQDLDRRLVLGGASLLLSGCMSAWPDVPGKPAQPPPAGVTDVHTHMFNASDLPVARFLEYAVLRPYFDQGAAKALIDLVVSVIQPLALTVKEETADLTAQGPRDVTPGDFARAAADRASGRSPSTPRLATQRFPESRAELLENYKELGAILAAAHGDAQLMTRARGLRAPDVTEDVAWATYREVFHRAAQAAASRTRNDRVASARVISAYAAGAFRLERAANLDLADFGTIVRTFAWVVLMMQPRTSHLKTYLCTYGDRDAQPTRIVNLLIDFGRWLQGKDDHEPTGPMDGSSIADQIDFWALAAQHYAAAIDIQTFAPYCPLQHAYDMRDPTAGHYLTDIETAYTSGKIAGLKIYPPMGFYPIGNKGLPDSTYVGDDGIRGGVVKAWNCKAPANSLGTALDKAQQAAYAMCKLHDIPILAHAGPSQMSASNFCDRPNPSHWEPVAAMGLRLMLGHFGFSASDFVAAMTNPHDPHTPHVWAIDSIAPLLKTYPNVFVDLAYVSDMLDDPKLADDFFKSLLSYCTVADSPGRACDPNFDHLVYGSDWIFLDRENNEGSYLKVMRDHITRTNGDGAWPAGAAQKIFGANADRFLRRTTGGARPAPRN